jgi:fused signal recognition particle receptor
MLNFLKKKDEPSATAGNNAPRSWRERLFDGLSRTRAQLGGQMQALFARGKVDDELLEELESLLLAADVGIEATESLLAALKERAKKEKLEGAFAIQNALAQAITELIRPLEAPLDTGTSKPFIIMIAGVNGAGKTTSIGKLAKFFQNQGKSVLLAAGDTFRAAAREQLIAWGERNNVTVISQESGDPAAVIFDAIHAARARNVDIVLADTAGRLPAQLHLMEEIAKIRRVIQKADPDGPHEVLLVLDANIGQNTLAQVKAFDQAIAVSGLVLTKLDGTAKGGIVLAIKNDYNINVKLIGTGEKIDDISEFSPAGFANSLIGI